MRRTRMVPGLVALWLLGATAGNAHADDAHGSDAQLRAQVQALLTAGVEPGGAHDKIAALGEPGERALRAVFENETAPRFVRLRALTVLASFNTAATAGYFESLVQSAHTGPRTDEGGPAAPDPTTVGDLHPARSALVLRRALEVLRELAPRMGARPGKPTTDAVTWCLSHPDAHVRKAAAALLATIEGPEQIDRALAERLTRERSRMVRASVERALTSRSVRSTTPR